MTPAFLKLINKQGVNIAPGEANWQGYEGWIALEHYALAPTRATSGAEGMGRLKTSTVDISKSWDGASVSLDVIHTKGIKFNAMLDVIIVDKRAVYRYDLSNANIEDIRISQSGRKDNSVTESLTITCDPIRMPQMLKR